MNSVSFKEWPKTSYPKALLSIIASVGGLAIFLLLASTLLVSQPIGSTVRGYFYGVNNSRKIDFESSLNHSVSESSPILKPIVDREKSNLTISVDHGNEVTSQHGGTKFAESGEGDSKETVIEKNQSPQSHYKYETSDSGLLESENLKDKLPHSKVAQEEDANRTLSLHDTAFGGNASVSSSNMPTELTESVESSAATTNLRQANVVDAGTISSSVMFNRPSDFRHTDMSSDAFLFLPVFSFLPLFNSFLSIITFV